MLWITNRRGVGRVAGALLLGAILLLLLGFRLQSPPPAASPLSTQDVVQRMVAMNAERTSDLRAYTAIRNYHLEYHGLGSDVADMQVQVTYQEPGPKRFTILAESGSGMLRHHVLEPLLRTERDEAAIEVSDGAALVPENYTFDLLDFPRVGSQASYVLAVKPRHDSSRFLFRGKIWINPVDFGLERAEGESVHPPSWWVPHVNFSYHSQKVGDFWLPASNDCVSHIRLFGHAVLTVTYQNFELTSIRPVNFQAAGAAQ